MTATRAPVARAALAAPALALLLVLSAAGCASEEERRDEHLARAEEYLERGEQRMAMIELRSALQLDPQNADINFRIAEVVHRAGDAADAAFFYGEAARLDPSRLEARVRQAELLMFEDPDRADEILDGVLEEDPSYARAYEIRSKAALIRGDTEAALQAALTAVELEPDRAEFHGQVGKVHQARIREIAGRDETPDDALYEQAIAAFERTSDTSEPGEKYQGLWQKGRVLAAWSGHGDEAAETYRAAIADAEKADVPARALNAVVPDAAAFAQSQGRTGLLGEVLEAWTRAAPTNWAAWSGLAQLVSEAGGSGDEVLQRMIEAQSENPQAHRHYASHLAETGRRDEAVAHLRAQAERGIDPPGTLGAAVNMLLAGRADHETAESIVEELEREHPDHPRTGLARAQLDMSQGRTEEAAQRLRLLTGRSELPAAYHLLATAEYGLGNSQAALAAVSRAIELDGSGFPHLSYRLRGRIEIELGDCTAGLATLTQLAQRGGAILPEERVLQAGCLYDLGRETAGRRLLERLMEDHPTLVPAVLEYAAREGERRPDEVRAALERALAQRPFDATLIAQLARFDIQAEQPEQALERLNRALEARATPTLLLQRAQVLATLGNLPAAQRDALRAFEAAPDSLRTAIFLVRLYRAQGSEAEVISSFEEANRAGALQAPAKYLLARLHLSQGDRERATELLEEVVSERPGLLLPKNDLAFFLAREQRDLDRALALAQSAQRGLGDVPYAIDTLGYVYLRRGLHEAAAEKFRQALRLVEEGGGNDPRLHYHLGLALQEMGRTDEAEQEFEAALALDAELEEAEEALQGLREKAETEAAEATPPS